MAFGSITCASPLMPSSASSALSRHRHALVLPLPEGPTIITPWRSSNTFEVRSSNAVTKIQIQALVKGGRTKQRVNTDCCINTVDSPLESRSNLRGHEAPCVLQTCLSWRTFCTHASPMTYCRVTHTTASFSRISSSRMVDTCFFYRWDEGNTRCTVDEICSASSPSVLAETEQTFRHARVA